MRLTLALFVFISGCAGERTAEPSASSSAEAATPTEETTPRSAPGPVDLSTVYAFDEETIDTTLQVGSDAFRVRLRQYVAPESTYTWQTGSYGDGRVDTFRYFDNALDVMVERNGDAVVERTLRKEDFAPVSGEEFVEGANLFGARFTELLPEAAGVRLSVGVYVPDTDVGDHVIVELEPDTVRLEVEPFEEG